MTKTALRLMLGFLLVVVVAAPSYSESGEAWHVYQCQILDATTEDMVIEQVEKWVENSVEEPGWNYLATVPGGGFIDHQQVMTAPTFLLSYSLH